MTRAGRTGLVFVILAAGAGNALAQDAEKKAPDGKDLFLAAKCNTCHSVTAAGIEKKKPTAEETAEAKSADKDEKKPPDLSKFLLSPMPGLLASLAVKAGQDIKVGQELCVVEAMKMENLLRAERDGRVGVVHAKPGDSLAVDQAILEFE